MSDYLITREGLELGSYNTPQIKKGLETGFFRLSDLAWRDALGWQGLSEIVNPVKALAAPSGAAALEPEGLNINPIAATLPHTQADAGGMVTPDVIAELTRTCPWLRFISSVMAIGCLLMILAAVIYLAEAGADSWADLPLQHLSKDTRHALMAAGSALLIFLILYPALKLSNYAAHIARLAQTQSPIDLAEALAEQRRVWRFYGILVIISIALVFLLMKAGMSIGSMKT